MGCQTVRIAAVNFGVKVSGLRKKMVDTPIRFNDMFPRSGLFSPLSGARASLPVARPNFVPNMESKRNNSTSIFSPTMPGTMPRHVFRILLAIWTAISSGMVLAIHSMTKLLNKVRLTNVHSRPGRQLLADASTRRNEQFEGRDEATHGLKMYKEDLSYLNSSLTPTSPLPSKPDLISRIARNPFPKVQPSKWLSLQSQVEPVASEGCWLMLSWPRGSTT